ncbi:putative xyloglucan:xyloglucosyl transferase [Rosa chinensis]|uniref:Putative xyloglucan:xyloglucosyl transferase n=1 Tax=Rosa chinensis TaxID=74649 RepID=A0A2P6PW71_ROSCH|nr:putative xyloglucan:xyloglucosyl transferase [Rosa chinensis]
MRITGLPEVDILQKIDWTQAPFTASYRNFSANSNSQGAWYWNKLDYSGKGQMQWVQKNYMIYNYCTDAKRFPLGFDPECYLTNLS